MKTVIAICLGASTGALLRWQAAPLPSDVIGSVTMTLRGIGSCVRVAGT